VAHIGHAVFFVIVIFFNTMRFLKFIVRGGKYLPPREKKKLNSKE
jgi:hypothetical protein